jgi:hypothetical protein
MHSDSPPCHHLGSSSGALFTLIQQCMLFGSQVSALPLLPLLACIPLLAMPELAMAGEGLGQAERPMGLGCAPLTCPGLNSRSHQQAAAVQGLLQRLLPHHAHLFTVTVQPAMGAGLEGSPSPAWFKAWSDGTHVHVAGSSGVEAAAGIHWFLKEYCGACITWRATGGAHIPVDDCLSSEGLQRLQRLLPLQRSRAVPLQYYQNVVTARCVLIPGPIGLPRPLKV